MLAGQLEIDLVAGIAQLTKDMGVAKSQVVGAMREINDAVETTKKAFEVLGVTLSIGFAVDFVKSSIDATARMKELGVQAGTTAEAISRFELPARAAGSSLEAVAVGMSHMSKAIVAGEDPANKSALALKAIGLSSKDLIDLKPDEAFIAVSKALAQYSDGAQKNAVIQQILGRATGDVKATLVEVAHSGQLAATVTNAQAEAANAFNTAVIQMKMQSEAAWRSLIGEGVPALTQIIQKFTEGKAAGGLFAGIFDGLATAFEKLNGDTLADQLGRINQSISVERANIDGMTNGWRAMVTTDNERAAATAHLNQLLAQRENVERAIFGAELEAQNRRALAGAGGKAPPNFDPNAGATAALFQQEMSQLDQEEAKLRGVGELEAYITKLGTDRYRLLTPLQKQELIDEEKKIVDLKNENAARQLLLASDLALIQAMQKMLDLEQSALDASKDQTDDLKLQISLLGLNADQQEKLNALHQIDLDLRKQMQQVTTEDDSDMSVEQAAQIQRLRDIADQRKQGVGQLLDEKKVISDQLAIWNQVGDAASNFFSDLVLHGKSAFDNLRQYVKQLLADLIGLFAKRFILQLAAGAAGGAATSAGASLGGAALSAGENTLGGAALNAVGGLYTGASMIGTGATAGGVASGVFGTSALVADDVAGATFVGTGVSGAVGTAAGFLGASAETAAAIASWVPVIGWVIAVAAILYAAFGNKGGGPKVGGSSFGTFAATGAFLGNTPVPGSDNGRFYTPDQLDPQMTSYRNAVAASYYSTVARYGGHALSLDIGGGADNDPRGSAQSRVSGIVVNHATGDVLYHNQDQGVDDKAVPATLTLQAQQMVIAALQHSDLPQYLANVFKGVDALTLTQDQVNSLFQTADALKAVFDIASRDPLADAAKAWTDALDPFDAALRNNGLAMRSVMDAYDGSATAATNLQQATTAYYNAQVQLLNQLTSAKQAIDGMFGDTFRGFKLTGMSDQDKYNFYQSEAQGLEQKALASTDPAEIQRLVQQITQDEQAAFALLTPEQQAGAVGQNFITQGTAAQQAIDTHIDHIKDAVAEATKDTLNEIKTLIAGPTGSMNSAANTMNGAANTIADSADRPLHVIVDNPGGAQEVTG